MIKPLHKNIAIQALPAEETTASGFVLASAAKEQEQIGEVKYLGVDVEDKDVVKVGDHVVYRQFSSTKVEYKGEDFIIVDLKDVIAILD